MKALRAPSCGGYCYVRVYFTGTYRIPTTVYDLVRLSDGLYVSCIEFESRRHRIVS